MTTPHSAPVAAGIECIAVHRLDPAALTRVRRLLADAEKDAGRSGFAAHADIERPEELATLAAIPLLGTTTLARLRVYREPVLGQHVDAEPWQCPMRVRTHVLQLAGTKTLRFEPFHDRPGPAIDVPTQPGDVVTFANTAHRDWTHGFDDGAGTKSVVLRTYLGDPLTLADCAPADWEPWEFFWEDVPDDTDGPCVDGLDFIGTSPDEDIPTTWIPPCRCKPLVGARP